ncbi:MAG: hypothetical protein NEA02_13630, partial [Thermoanaerobaculia bacterium]|nr:hypothetical protein [Thermoanaerobaculia bacterium]
MQDSEPKRPDRARLALALLVLALAGAILYSARVGESPPGFYLDESSIAFNAHAVAETGRDEHGEPWPLFFRAFGEYKNPVYVYLLAGLFRLTGPGIVPARLLSAGLVVGAALALALLAWRLSRRLHATLLTGLSALLTPWFFGLGHVVLEIAIYPLAVALFLLAVRRAVERSRWSRGDGVAIAAALALLTYGYSTGRLLGPLLALALACFVTRARPFEVARVWIPYAVFLIPIGLFHLRYPGALTGRFLAVSYLGAPRGGAAVARDFLSQLAANLDPRRLLVIGDPNPHQVAHLYGSAPLLLATGVLVLLGAWRA